MSWQQGGGGTNEEAAASWGEANIGRTGRANTSLCLLLSPRHHKSGARPRRRRLQLWGMSSLKAPPLPHPTHHCLEHQAQVVAVLKLPCMRMQWRLPAAQKGRRVLAGASQMDRCPTLQGQAQQRRRRRWRRQRSSSSGGGGGGSTEQPAAAPSTPSAAALTLWVGLAEFAQDHPLHLSRLVHRLIGADDLQRTHAG